MCRRACGAGVCDRACVRLESLAWDSNFFRLHALQCFFIARRMLAHMWTGRARTHAPQSCTPYKSLRYISWVPALRAFRACVPACCGSQHHAREQIHWPRRARECFFFCSVRTVHAMLHAMCAKPAKRLWGVICFHLSTFFGGDPQMR